MITVIGVPLSPYVRKVMMVCALKNIPYQIDPFPPFFGGDRFSEISPLRRIPVLIDGALVLPDSSVICQYLEDRYPAPALYPPDIAERAEARWLEEYADTRMGDVFIWKIFNEACIKPAIWKSPRDTAAIAAAVANDLPDVMNYLERHAPPDRFKFGALSIADISVAVLFRNLLWSRVQADPGRWPRTMAWVERVTDIPAFRSITSAGDDLLRVPPPDMRDAMKALGFTITAETLSVPVPRRGPMSV